MQQRHVVFATLLLLLCGPAVPLARAVVRVAVVNDIPGHFEVLAGVVDTLRRVRVQQSVYYVGNPKAPWTMGLVDWLQSSGATLAGSSDTFNGSGSIAQGGSNSLGRWHPIVLQKSDAVLEQVQLVICISAELAPQVCCRPWAISYVDLGHLGIGSWAGGVCQGMVALLRPKLLMLWVHRADASTRGSKILTLHSNFALLALAPHVAKLAAARMQQPVGWALPVMPFTPSGRPCRSKACLQGFAIQGALRRFSNATYTGLTRSYPELWARLAELRAKYGSAGAVASGPVKVVVVGKGQRASLMIPPQIDEDVSFYSRLPYEHFWGNISAAYALVPAFGMTVYTRSRISSTLLASLICGVPVIADRELLDAYSFLTEEHVFLREPGEDEAAAMYRIMHRLPEAEVFSRREALLQLQRQMNVRSEGVFQQLMARAAS